MSVSQVQVIHINDTFCMFGSLAMILNVTIHGTQSLIDGIVIIIVKVTIVGEPKQVTS